VQGSWCNAEYQPAAIPVQKGACRVHAVFQFAGRFLQFQATILVVGYQLLDIFDCHGISDFSTNLGGFFVTSKKSDNFICIRTK
jgi:hypothetical protein